MDPSPNPAAIPVEIAIQSLSDATIARDAGANQLELCSALPGTGGLTPSLGMVEAVAECGLRMKALLRSRPGDFRYSAAERKVMLIDARLIAESSLAELVIGATRPDTRGEVLDRDFLEDVVAAVDGRVKVHLHRAFDVVHDPLGELHFLAELGISSVLTSGQAATAPAGTPTLKEWRSAFDEYGLGIVAGGGINASNVAAVLAARPDAIHASCSQIVPSPGPSGPGGGAAEVTTTDAAAARALVRAVAESLSGNLAADAPAGLKVDSSGNSAGRL